MATDAQLEDGFTLIELLVVVTVIGILAAIAIPVFLGQRQQAYVAQMESDLYNAALQMEQGYRETDGAYDADALDAFRPTRGVVTVQTVLEDQQFCLTATVDGVGSRSWHSNRGGLQADGLGCD